MSEGTTPESTPKSGFELVPNPAGTEEGAGGSEDTGLFAEGASPGLDAEPPEQQTPAPPQEQVAVPEQQAEVTTQQPIPAKEDASRFEYHQAQADLYKNESARDRKERDEIKGSQTYAIARYIQQNPDMLDVVEEGMRGGPVTRPKRIPERPIRPQRPDNYDASEAHDPETVSGRYRESYSDYLEKKDIYQDAREEQETTKATRDADKAKLAELKGGVVSLGRVSSESFDKVIQAIDSEGPVDPVVFERFCLAYQAPSQDEIANKEKAKQLLAKQKGLEAPLPVATAGGESPLPTTDEDDYHASIREFAGSTGSLL